MRLLVSVSSPTEALAARAGGADVIDAKNPRAGALGAVTLQMLQRIHAVVEGQRPVTAALGDAADGGALERMARTFTTAGARLVKVGFAGVPDARRVASLLDAAVHGAAAGDAQAGVVAVAYADAERVGSPAATALVDLAARMGAAGILLDTADKAGPGLRDLWTPAALTAWVADARRAGLLVALAGKLRAEDLPLMCAAGADIAGVRSAACAGGREGRVIAARVRRLRAIVQAAEPPPRVAGGPPP